MFKPSLDGDSPDCYSSALDSLNVHYSSGVANHFYYLLAEGAVVPSGFGSGTSWNVTQADSVYNGNTALTATGRAAASRIWHHALTVDMTSWTNDAAARRATLCAATESVWQRLQAVPRGCGRTERGVGELMCPRPSPRDRRVARGVAATAPSARVCLGHSWERT